MPQPRPFRLGYRSFTVIEYDPAKSDEFFEQRGFDFPYVSRIFPGYVLERKDTRTYGEKRFQAIGEVLGEVFVVIYTRRGDVCGLITAWVAEQHERDLWYDITR